MNPFPSSLPRTRVPAFLVITWMALGLLNGCANEPPPEENPETVVSVEVGKVTKKDLRSFVEGYGRLVPEIASQGGAGGGVLLSTSRAGNVREIAVKEGQKIQAGELVVLLDDRVEVAALNAANARLTYADQTLERIRTMFGQGNASQRDLESAGQEKDLAEAAILEAEGNLSQVQLRSPLDGIVARIHVHPGQAVDQTSVLAEIIDPDRMEAAIFISAREAGSIRVGQAAELNADTMPPTTIAAKVSFVSPSVDANGSVLVRLKPSSGYNKASSAASSLLSGAFVRGKIAVEEHKNVLAVPRGSIHLDGMHEGTLSYVKDDMAYKISVGTGLVDGGWVEVISDELSESMDVVTTGSFALPDTTRIAVSPAGQ